MKEFTKNMLHVSEIMHVCETCIFAEYKTKIDEFGCTATIPPILCKHDASVDRSLWPEVDPNNRCNKFEFRYAS
jgi:hypothetical protein